MPAATEGGGSDFARSTKFTGVLHVNPPIRVKSGSFLNDQDYFRKHVTLATAKAAEGDGSVLILLDCSPRPAVPKPQHRLGKTSQLHANKLELFYIPA